MKFLLTYTSHYQDPGRYVELKTMEELMKLIRDEECSIIVNLSFDEDENCDGTLEIYDDYRE